MSTSIKVTAFAALIGVLALGGLGGAARASDGGRGRVLVRRSAPSPPAWTRRAPPPDGEYLYFSGFATGTSGLGQIRDAAARRAIAEAVAWLGMDVTSFFSATEVEDGAEHRQRVSVGVEIAGRKVTLRGVQLADTYYEEWRDGTQAETEVHALIRWPVAEHRALLAAEEAQRAAARAAAESAHARRSVTVQLRCGDGALAPPAAACEALERSLLEGASSAGWRAFRAGSSTAAAYRLEAAADVRMSGEIGGIAWARAGASLSLTDVTTGAVAQSAVIEPRKAGQLTAERALEAALSALRVPMTQALRTLLRKEQPR